MRTISFTRENCSLKKSEKYFILSIVKQKLIHSNPLNTLGSMIFKMGAFAGDKDPLLLDLIHILASIPNFKCCILQKQNQNHFFRQKL